MRSLARLLIAAGLAYAVLDAAWANRATVLLAAVAGGLIFAAVGALGWATGGQHDTRRGPETGPARPPL